MPLRTRQFRGALPLMSRHGSRGPLRMIAMPAFSSSASSSLGSYSWPRGNVLAVGEGDFTFSALLVAHAQARGDFRQGGGCDSIHGASSTQPFQLLATTLDAAVDLPRLYPTSVKRALAELDVAATSSSLPRGAIAVAYGVNATQLEVSPEVRNVSLSFSRVLSFSSSNVSTLSSIAEVLNLELVGDNSYVILNILHYSCRHLAGHR